MPRYVPRCSLVSSADPARAIMVTIPASAQSRTPSVSMDGIRDPANAVMSSHVTKTFLFLRFRIISSSSSLVAYTLDPSHETPGTFIVNQHQSASPPRLSVQTPIDTAHLGSGNLPFGEHQQSPTDVGGDHRDLPRRGRRHLA